MEVTGNSLESVTEKAWQFKPGQSGNPSGRPKSEIGATVRALHGDGKRLVQLLTDVAFAEGQFQGARIPLPIRIEAANWLADRGWGKPVQSTEISAPEGAVILYMPRSSDDAPLLLTEGEGS